MTFTSVYLENAKIGTLRVQKIEQVDNVNFELNFRLFIFKKQELIDINYSFPVTSRVCYFL